MSLILSVDLLNQIHSHGEAAYPEEGAGLLLGNVEGGVKRALAILKLENGREDGARHNRFLISPSDFLRGEQEAARLGLDVIGVFHSHPDHPNQPSEFDRQWALPWFSYIITTVQNGQAIASRCWLLAEDRQAFYEEKLILDEQAIPEAGPDLDQNH